MANGSFFLMHRRNLNVWFWGKHIDVEWPTKESETDTGLEVPDRRLSAESVARSYNRGSKAPRPLAAPSCRQGHNAPSPHRQHTPEQQLQMRFGALEGVTTPPHRLNLHRKISVVLGQRPDRKQQVHRVDLCDAARGAPV